ncbi:hypothetical protein, conserved [Leishmania tarentolae]|uniref:Uncharacterized protein n=1 Tax=Leishmania tarentolae TaxID=5689 RepID=A0A640KB06_LEITA|nr:hypothetical protein, conserved [Leishmania tarentolae]
MSGEFSLLQHLGVTVEKCDAPADPPPPPHSTKETFRVWAPTQQPPSKVGIGEETCRILEKKRKGAHPSYADPTGEVLLRRKNGVEVQYIVYDSKVPSVYGVNKRLAEKKVEREREENSLLVKYYLPIGKGEAGQEEARRALLQELRRCNQEQARMRKEEELRERAKRIAHERAVAQYNAAEAARAEEEEEAIVKRKMYEAFVSEAAAKGVTMQEERRATTNVEDRLIWTGWDGKDEDDRRRLAVAERTRQLAKENLRAAEKRRAERKAQEQEAREKAQAERMELQRELAQEHVKELERHRLNAEALRYAQETERERRTRANIADAHLQAVPSGSLFDAVEKRQRDEAARAQQKRMEDMAVNARLAAQKRADAQAERDRERQYAADFANAELQNLEREVERARQRRQQERLLLQDAAEAAAKARQAQKDTARRREQSMEPLLFWPVAQSEGAEEVKIAKTRHFHEELRRQAEKKRRERAQEEEAERGRERALIEYDTRSAQEAVERERKEAREKAEDLRRILEAQIAEKRKRTARDQDACAAVDVTHDPARETRVLYRCPVTGDLLPASAYDFGVQRGR